jgi:hypothetical protein
MSSFTISHCFLSFFLAPEKREKQKDRFFWDLDGIVSPYLSSHGETRLDPFQGYA